MDSLLYKIKSYYSNSNKITNINQSIDNKLTISEINRRKLLIEYQTKIMYNLGDWELRNAIKKVYDHNYKISYSHIWSNKGYSVGTIGKSLNIIFYRNFFEKHNQEKFSQCELMRYAGCINDEGCIRSMLIHELGHVNFREYTKNRWISILSDSHNRHWSNWIAIRFLKFNSIVKSFRPDLLIGYLILNKSNLTYENPDKNIMDLLLSQYNELLKKYGYISNKKIFPYIENPLDW